MADSGTREASAAASSGPKFAENQGAVVTTVERTVGGGHASTDSTAMRSKRTKRQALEGKDNQGAMSFGWLCAACISVLGSINEKR
jgi:hypothetical protein